MARDSYLKNRWENPNPVPKYVQELQNLCRKHNIPIRINAEQQVVAVSYRAMSPFSGFSGILCDIRAYHFSWYIKNTDD